MARGDVSGALTQEAPTYIEGADGTLYQAVVPVGLGGESDPFGTGASAFGESLTVRTTPGVQLFTNDIGDTRRWSTFSAGGGSVAFADGQATLSISTGVGDYYSALSVRSVPYSPGTGVSVRFTAFFDSGAVANSLQLAGAYHAEDGLGVGYNGTTFGVLRRVGRKLEIRSLTVSSAASGGETAAVELNGTTTNVTLTGGGTVNDDAREIAETAFTGWDAYQLGAVVYFLRLTHGAASGAYSYSSSTSAGTFAQVQAGANGTETWTAQAAWDDPLDGTGASGVTLDPTALNIYEARYAWLGAMGTQWLIADPSGQRMIPFHFDPWHGANATPWARDPRFPIGYSVASLGSATALAMGGASCGGFAHGGSTDGPPIAVSASGTATTTEAPILSVRCAPINVARGSVGRRTIVLNEIEVYAATKDVTVRAYIGTPSNLTGYDFSQAGQHYANWDDTSATAITGSMQLIRTFEVESGTARVLSGAVLLERKQTLIVTVESSASTTAVRCDLFGLEAV